MNNTVDNKLIVYLPENSSNKLDKIMRYIKCLNKTTTRGEDETGKYVALMNIVQYLDFWFMTPNGETVYITKDAVYEYLLEHEANTWLTMDVLDNEIQKIENDTSRKQLKPKMIGTYGDLDSMVFYHMTVYSKWIIKKGKLEYLGGELSEVEYLKVMDMFSQLFKRLGLKRVMVDISVVDNMGFPKPRAYKKIRFMQYTERSVYEREAKSYPFEENLVLISYNRNGKKFCDWNIIKCCDCGKFFRLSGSERAFIRNYERADPIHCKSCSGYTVYHK